MSSWSDFSSKVKAASTTSGRGSSKDGKADAKQVDDGRMETSGSSGSHAGARLTSSFADLKSEVAAQRARKNKREDGERWTDKSREWDTIVGKREKKLPHFLRPSPNVASRSSRHDHRTTSPWAATPSSQLDDVRAKLERKARLYDQLQRGKTGGLSEERLQDSLVDWDRKGTERWSDESEEESASGAGGSAGLTGVEDDPLTEYEDEFGRMRRVRRSEVPRAAQRAKERQEEEHVDEAMIIHGPSTSFPVYRPDPSRHTQSSIGGYKREAPDHFDARSEKRYRGAGFYQFSQDETVRERQMEELQQERTATEREREGELEALQTGTGDRLPKSGSGDPREDTS